MNVIANRHERRKAAALERRRKLSTPEASAYSGLSIPYLNRLRTTGGGPAYLKIGSRVVYDRDDIDVWLAKHRRTSTSDTGDRG